MLITKSTWVTLAQDDIYKYIWIYGLTIEYGNQSHGVAKHIGFN